LRSSAGYFVGTDIGRSSVSICITDFKGSTVAFYPELPFRVESSEDSFKELCNLIRKQVAKSGVKSDSIMAYGINLSGRVNNETGYCFTYFIGEDRPIASLLEDEFNTPVFVENDSRAMTYGEYLCGGGHGEKDMLFLNVTWGLGMGMVIDGKLSYGKSGFSGEIGHFPMMNNGQICHCGKTGCLETAASGSAAHRIVVEKLEAGQRSLLSDKFKKGEEITLVDILNAAMEDDVLAIEAIEEIGTNLGRAIAGLINIFNPELVVLGGEVAKVREYLLLPVRSAIQKHSLNLVNKDTTIKFSTLGDKAGPVGACMLSRTKLLGLM
jgi:predicted NBD/HSP70 family sugar kinase